MSLSSDNFTALIHLRDQARKWKNITFTTIIIALIIVVKVSFIPKKDDDNLTNNSKYIAVVDVDGVIFDNKYRTKVLKEIKDKDNIKAVILNINSPGGSIVASEVLYKNILDISKRKPVIAVLGSLAASGGYMAAIGSNHIIAHNGTLTGSVGVILQSAEVTELADNLGIKFQNYKSSHLKGSPSPFEKSDPAIDRVINASVQDSYNFFSDLVLERRKGKIANENKKIILDGRVFTGRQALKVGLVDQIGGEEDALDYLEKNYKLSKLPTKDVSLNKIDNKILDKILNGRSIENILNGSFSNKKLMAIW